MSDQTPETQAGESRRSATEWAGVPRPLRVIGIVVSVIALKVVTIGTRICRAVDDYIFGGKKALYGTAVLRILFGLTGLGLLLSNLGTSRYSFGSGAAWNGEIAEPVSDFPKIWIFSTFHSIMQNDVLFGIYYGVLILLAVLFILGWRFRIVLPIYFVLWVGFIESNDMLGDQGDNMYRIVLILMFFTDAAARWSLDARRRATHEWVTPGGTWNQIGSALHNLALVALAAQVIFVYTSGAMFKSGGAPWREGWAVYSPLQTTRFGNWPALSDVLTAWGPMVALFTLGSIFIQAGFPFMLLHRFTRVIALFGILSFHIGIAVLMGLPWFSLAMIAIDAIFIRDRTWERMKDGLRAAWSRSRNGPDAVLVP
ncbi:HTTM domain-containing protein [Leucobacter zeae]|nr:HTTM domain-containing protein [Leucobacter zeae]